MSRYPARITLLIAFLTLLNMKASADPEGFPGGGLKPTPTTSTVQSTSVLP